MLWRLESDTSGWRRTVGEAGYLEGRTLEGAGWVHQTTRDGVPGSGVVKLDGKESYRVLRELLAGDAAVGVIVWHEVMWKTSREKAEQWVQVQKA